MVAIVVVPPAAGGGGRGPGGGGRGPGGGGRGRPEAGGEGQGSALFVVGVDRGTQADRACKQRLIPSAALILELLDQVIFKFFFFSKLLIFCHMPFEILYTCQNSEDILNAKKLQKQHR